MEFTSKKRSAGGDDNNAGAQEQRQSSQSGNVRTAKKGTKKRAEHDDNAMTGVDDGSTSDSKFVYGADGSIEGVVGEDGEQLVFEDPFGDEFEQEEVYEEDNEDDYDPENITVDEHGNEVVTKKSSKAVSIQAAEADEAPKQTFRPGVDAVGEGEELDYDPSAYVMYHSLRTEWPCLSFDIMRDDLGDNRQRFPLTMYMACGSQADRGDKNRVTLLKLSDLHKTQANDDSENEESDNDDDLDEDPTLEHINIPHIGGVNRLRCMPQQPGVIATFSETRVVNIFDASALFRSLCTGIGAGREHANSHKPAYMCKAHRDEGFAIDWSNVCAGRLASGDCAGVIHITNSNGAGGWATDAHAYTGHTGSVEDLQWSPSEQTVFISCSADRSVRVWDVRGKSGPQITIPNAHTEDVNVCSWNKSVSYLLASGSDDGSFKVWDLRSISQKREPLANFKYHSGPITSIEWAPHDESVLCVSSADNQVTVWDLSVEGDESSAGAGAGAGAGAALNDFPPQLLFIHQGQSNIKEVHHHPQIPGLIVSTAEDGFNVFKPAIHAT